MPSAGAAGSTAALSGLVAGPSIASLPIDGDEAARALAAFRTSCPSLVRRDDSSGLTRGADWQPACDAAQATSDRDARAFFARWFEAAQVGDGRAYATGYFIPEVRASRERRHGYDVPIYGRPADLIDVDLGLFADSLAGKKIRGRVSGTALVPYYDRTAIEQGAIEKTAPVLAWGADPAEVFFLQIQGSGELRFRDGSVMRVGYDDQNGRDYTGIGKLMLDRGLIGRGEASMQGIVAWLRAHPDQGREIMRENKSFVFFRRLEGAAVGALGLPVIGGVSAAVDPKFVPLGAPVFLSMDRTDATGIWIAQDTGGAIKGANRFDTFWGAGDEAAAIAGGMAARGTAFLLLPKGTLVRLQSGG
jgi:membrane-bound lytic murein transglycosylase A